MALGLFLFPRKNKRGAVVNVHSSKSFLRAGFNPADQTIIIIHGFNGTESSEHMGYLRDGEWLAKKRQQRSRIFE